MAKEKKGERKEKQRGKVREDARFICAAKAKEKRKRLTWRTKGEIILPLEVCYVPSSPQSGAASLDPALPRSSPRSAVPAFQPIA